jgi:hypothetical protein
VGALSGDGVDVEVERVSGHGVRVVRRQSRLNSWNFVEEFAELRRSSTRRFIFLSQLSS